MRTYPIHIAFCINDAYAKYVCVTVKSIVENHSGDVVTLHFLSDDLSEKSKDRLSEAIIGAENRVKLVYHVMEAEKYRGLRVKRYWPRCIWYRFALCEVLPQEIHRVLYLDADTVVTTNLVPLFQVNMEEKSIAAVYDINCVLNEHRPSHLGYDDSKGYECSGVILMNLDYWRHENLLKRLMDYATSHSQLLSFPDQDAMNVICLNSKVALPWKYNVMYHTLMMDESYESYLDEMKQCIDSPAIIHYTSKPWFVETGRNHPQYRVWRYYNRKLKHPVKIVYLSKGWIPLKIFVWNMLHPSVRKSRMTISKIRKKIASYECRAEV